MNGLGARMIVLALVTLATAGGTRSRRAGPAETTVFTLAGAGDAMPREGAAATDVRLGERALAGLPDRERRRHRRAQAPAVDRHGRPHPSPPTARRPGRSPPSGGRAGRDAARGLAAWPLGVALGAGWFGVAAVVRPAPHPRLDVERGRLFVAGLAVLAAGAIAVSGSEGVWRLTADGGTQRVLVPPSEAPFSSAGALAALPDGTLVFTYAGSDALAFVHGRPYPHPARRQRCGSRGRSRGRRRRPRPARRRHARRGHRRRRCGPDRRRSPGRRGGRRRAALESLPGRLCRHCRGRRRHRRRRTHTARLPRHRVQSPGDDQS